MKRASSRRSQRFFLPGLMLFAAAACSDGSGPAPGYVGRYELVSAGGQPLPMANAQGEGDTLKYLGGYVEIRADGQYRMHFDYEIVGAARPIPAPDDAGPYTTSEIATTGPENWIRFHLESSAPESPEGWYAEWRGGNTLTMGFLVLER